MVFALKLCNYNNLDSLHMVCIVWGLICEIHKVYTNKSFLRVKN